MPQLRGTIIPESPWLSTPGKLQPDFADLGLPSLVLTGDVVNLGSYRRSPSTPLH